MTKQVQISERTLGPGENLMLVVDVEGVGEYIGLQPILSLGWVVCARINFDDPSRSEEEIFEKGRVSFRPDIYSMKVPNRERFIDLVTGTSEELVDQNGWLFGKECYNKFWARQPPHVLATLLQESVAPEEAMEKFMGVEERFPIGRLMSDNTAHDLPRIDRALERYSDRRCGIHYTADGKHYRTASDPSAAYDFLPPGVRSKIRPEITSYFPDDNALDTYRFALEIKNAVNDWGRPPGLAF